MSFSRSVDEMPIVCAADAKASPRNFVPTVLPIVEPAGLAALPVDVVGELVAEATAIPPAPITVAVTRVASSFFMVGTSSGRWGEPVTSVCGECEGTVRRARGHRYESRPK